MAGRDSVLDQIIRRAQSLGPDEQAAFLERACGTDESLYSEVIRTLQSGSQPQWWDQSLPEGDSQASSDRAEFIGTLIGPYRVIASLGSGGMGEVFLAERADDQFRQRVAIKLVRSGLLSRQVQGRLRARTADPCNTVPPQHCKAARWRHHHRRCSIHCDGTH